MYRVHEGKIAAEGGVWNVVGPYPEFPHIQAFWCCENEAQAREWAEKMNGGWVPPRTETCSGCGIQVPEEEIQIRTTATQSFGYCRNCEG